MKHIDDLLKKNTPRSFDVQSNVDWTVKGLVWDHNNACKAHFGESMVAASVLVATGGGLDILADVFKGLSRSLYAAKEVTQVEIDYLGSVWTTAEDTQAIKNGKHGTKLFATPLISLLTRWIRDESGVGGTTKGYHEPAELDEYLNNSLTKETMAFAAGRHIMAQMGLVVEEALASRVIDNDFICSKVIQRDKQGKLKQGSIMGAVFWLGLAYKSHHKTTVNADGSIWSFSAYVDLKRAKLNAALNKCADEQWEVGQYLIADQDEVEALEHKLCQYELLAPFAERLFDNIDLWNVIQHWSYVPNDMYAKIILNKVPPEKTDEDKIEDLEAALAKMERYELSNRDGKKSPQSLYDELVKAAAAAKTELEAIA